MQKCTRLNISIIFCIIYNNTLIPYCFFPVVFRCGTLLGHTLINTVWNTSQSPAPLPPQPLL